MQTPNVNTIQMNGEYGNKSVAIGKAIFAADAAGATGAVIKLPPMAKVTDVKMVHDNLGAGTTVKLDAVGDSGSTVILAAQTTSAAGRKNYDGKSILLTEATDLVVTTAGGTATGEVELQVTYVYVGA